MSANHSVIAPVEAESQPALETANIQNDPSVQTPKQAKKNGWGFLALIGAIFYKFKFLLVALDLSLIFNSKEIVLSLRNPK